MPQLGDYIGLLLSEFAIARLHADIESMRIAELYASHQLLKYMPVPHFRLPSVSLDIPVVIKELDKVLSDAPRGKLDFIKMRKEFDRLLDISLNKIKIELKNSEKKHLHNLIDETMEHLKLPASVSISVIPIAKGLVSAVVKFLSDPKREGPSVDLTIIEKFGVEFEEEVGLSFINLRQEPPRLHVLATTPEIKEAGPNDIVARFHLSMTEEAVEWTVIEVGGKSQDRLVPE